MAGAVNSKARGGAAGATTSSHAPNITSPAPRTRLVERWRQELASCAMHACGGQSLIAGHMWRWATVERRWHLNRQWFCLACLSRVSSLAIPIQVPRVVYLWGCVVVRLGGCVVVRLWGCARRCLVPGTCTVRRSMWRKVVWSTGGPGRAS